MIYFKSSIIFILIDIFWIFLNTKTYNNLVYNIQGSNMIFNLNKFISLLITYLILLIGLNFIVIPYNIPMLFGLVTYGVYSFTNYSLYNNYPVKLAIIDTLWGIILYFLANKYK